LSDELRWVFRGNDDLPELNSNERGCRKDATVILEGVEGGEASFNIGSTKLKLSGVYNAFNSAGALAMVREILPEIRDDAWLGKLSQVETAFGRGEKIGDIELILVKNPGGFRLSLESFKEPYLTMIAINDEYADGRDVSWLWDVDFSSLNNRVVITSGIRSADMALRLKYDEIEVSANEPDLIKAVQILQEGSGEKYIFCTYTAMLKIRKYLTGKSIS